MSERAELKSPDLLNIDSSGALVLEWWRGSRKLTLYAKGSGVHYLKTTDDGQIQDGDVDESGLLGLIDWVNGA